MGVRQVQKQSMGPAWGRTVHMQIPEYTAVTSHTVPHAPSERAAARTNAQQYAAARAFPIAIGYLFTTHTKVRDGYVK